MKIHISAFVLCSQDCLKLWKATNCYKSCYSYLLKSQYGCLQRWYSERGCPSLKQRKSSGLHMKDNEWNNKSSYYKRPSKALRRGGGFFVPGFKDLELERVIGGILLLAFLLNISTIENWTPSLRLSLLSCFLAILLWCYLQFLQPTFDAATEGNRSQLVSTESIHKERNMCSSISLENELQWLLEVLENFCRVEYLSIYEDVEPFITVPSSVSVDSLVHDVAELLFRNVNKALSLTISPPCQPELLCFLPNGLTSQVVGLWLYPFYCALLQKRFTFVVCFEGTQMLSPANGKWLVEWVKNRLIPYLESSRSYVNF